MIRSVYDDLDYAPFLQQFEQAGFARIPVSDALARDIDRIYRLGEEFFVRSEADKQRYSMQSFVEGYRELGPEYSQVPERPDLTESFSAWNRNRGRPEVEEVVGGLELHRALREVSDQFSVMVRGIFRAMADAWAPGSPELRFYNGTYVQVNYYEPAQHSAELLQDPHEDAHLLTLAKANAPGLEIEVDGTYVSAESDGNDIVFMPGSLLSLMTGYKIKPMYHQVRNTRRRDPRSALLMFVNPEIDQKLEPWIKNQSNAGIDIIERANEGPKQFGMPTLLDGTAGEAFPELMEHKEAVLSEASQPVRIRR
ncbi:2OG-Fe(II) oxygenase family protein [Dongia deserti]|uniref:2OG-Fe(II) oxygenase family protein n=1 Tax=Dongia deserti TaxID=2268030 RepID=UPI0013C4519B|nr:2OG-Fe(II) oxygenase family protein [Dongia deserti]